MASSSGFEANAARRRNEIADAFELNVDYKIRDAPDFNSRTVQQREELAKDIEDVKAGTIVRSIKEITYNVPRPPVVAESERSEPDEYIVTEELESVPASETDRDSDDENDNFDTEYYYQKNNVTDRIFYVERENKRMH